MVSFIEIKSDSSQPESERNCNVAPAMDNVVMDEGEADTRIGNDEQISGGVGWLKRQQQRKQIHTPTSNSPEVAAGAPTNARLPPQVPPAGPGSVDGDTEDLDEEQLKRILNCKRLSEGNCNRHLVNLNICRKNSLHLIGESLPPVTEGEPMRHMSHHMSQTMEGSQSSSASSSSLRGGGRHLTNKRSFQDDNTTSCSSSTSLDGSGGGLRSPSRRRSSTVSQCSSVLSEGTRQQLNFDLSPDLPPDSSILEANAISPTDFDRPASPEPSSLGSVDGSFEMRPISGMSQFCDDMTTDAASPDSTLGDSTLDNANPTDNAAQPLARMRQQCDTKDETTTTTTTTMSTALRHSTKTVLAVNEEASPDWGMTAGDEATSDMTSEKSVDDRHRQRGSSDQISYDANITDNLERIISHVSEVKVSSNTPADQLDFRLQLENGPVGDSLAADVAAAGMKRAHTPFGASIQRNKATHVEFRD